MFSLSCPSPFVHSCCCVFREETVGSGPISGDEHTLQVLVLLLERQLQQEDVWRVQAVRRGGGQGELQVRLEHRPYCLSLDNLNPGIIIGSSSCQLSYRLSVWAHCFLTYGHHGLISKVKWLEVFFLLLFPIRPMCQYCVNTFELQKLVVLCNLSVANWPKRLEMRIHQT